MTRSYHEAIPDYTRNRLSEIDIAAIASRLPTVLRSFPHFEFAAGRYCLISDVCVDAIRIHIAANLVNLPLCRVSLAVLMSPITSQAAHDAVVGAIKVKLPAGRNNGVAESARTLAFGAVTGANVQASGLAELYFAALSVRIAQFTWDAVHFGQRAVYDNAGESLISSKPARRIIALDAHDLGDLSPSPSKKAQPCMHDSLVEKRLSRKAIALAIMQALLPFYSARGLYEALCELHNSDAVITTFLRENSSTTSAYFRVVPTSWTKAVADIKSEAQRRLTANGAVTDTDWLNAVIQYHSSMYSSVAIARVSL